MTLILNPTPEPAMPHISGTSAVQLFDLAAEALDASGGGRYRGFNLVTELHARGIELNFTGVIPEQKPLVAPAEMQSASDLGLG